MWGKCGMGAFEASCGRWWRADRPGVVWIALGVVKLG